jgi:hypothetical protein
LQQSITPRCHKLRSFGDVTGEAERKRGSKRRSVIKEAKNYSIVQSDETTELSYLVLSVPKNLSYDEKMRRPALLADKVTGVEDSDAICIAAWVPSDSEQ